VAATVGALVVVAASVGWWVDRTMFDADQLADRAVALLDEPAVRDAVADELRADLPLTTAVDRLVPGAVDDAVADPAFRPIFRGAIEEAHGFLMDPSVPSVTIDLDGYTSVLADMAGRRDPALRGAVESTARDLDGVLSADTFTFDRSDLPAGWDALVSSRRSLIPLAVVGVVLVIAAVALHPRHLAAAGWAGAVLLVGGVALAASAALLGDASGPQRDLPVHLSAAGSLVVDRFASDLVPQSLGLALIGLLCLAAALGGRLVRTRNLPT
jgi:hypothetical protein